MRPEDRARAVADSRALYELAADLIGKPVPPTHACLYHAIALQFLLAKRGLKTMLQAGTCQWPLLEPADDDGVGATHYAYQWDGLSDPAVLRCLHDDPPRLPEMHVWLAHRDPDTIIDPTTGTWPERARATGLTWSALEPPAFVWHTADELSDLVAERHALGVTYKVDLEACRVADAFATLELYPTITHLLRRT